MSSKLPFFFKHGDALVLEKPHGIVPVHWYPKCSVSARQHTIGDVPTVEHAAGCSKQSHVVIFCTPLQESPLAIYKASNSLCAALAHHCYFGFYDGL